MYELYANVMQVLSCIVEGYCLFLLGKNFLSPKTGEGVWSEAVPGIFWGVLRFLASCFDSSFDSMVLAVKYLVCWCILCVFFVMYYQGKAAFKLFVAAMFLSLRELSFFVAYSLIGVGSFGIDIVVCAYEKGWMGEETFLTTAEGIGNVSVFCEVLTEGILLYLGVRFLLKIMPKGFQKKEERELLFCMLPAEASLLVGFVLKMMMFLTEDGQPRTLYQKYPPLYGLVPVISLVLYASVLFNTWLYQRICEQKEKQREQEMLQNQIMQMQGAMQEMERLYDGIRGVRHDMKNQMLALQGVLSKSGEGSEELKEFLTDMYRCVEQLDYGIHTGNSVCDVVIGSKFALAKKKLSPISLNAENFLVTDAFHVRAYDLGIMLNNGLDNAIEAIERMRKAQPEKEAYIMVRSYVRGGMIFIEIENSFSGSLQFEENSSIPISQKQGEGHGIGLRNIRNCARKYNGEVDCVVQGEKFILSIMIGGRQMRSIFRMPSDDLPPNQR